LYWLKDKIVTEETKLIVTEKLDRKKEMLVNIENFENFTSNLIFIMNLL